MCGITGFVGDGDKDTLQKMFEAIRHRGPDDSGFFLKKGMGFAHARLSIIDLSPAGHQPMIGAHGKVVLMFNGEIYNFQTLGEELLKTKKYVFKGQSDTEVILNLYLEYGEECFKKLSGMFAIAIFDFRSSKLILSRDRLGKKPLYWGRVGETFLFGSELKALLAHPLCKKTLNLDALNMYLAHDYVPTPHSIIKDVYKLEPATYLTYQAGKVAKKSFWQMDFQEKEVLMPEAMDKLDTLLRQSVERRLIADVPLGIFLSGGLDSSTVAYYAQELSPNKIKTFSIGFSEKSFDESALALEVARSLDTEHYQKILSAKDSLDLVPKIAEIIDEPLADASVIPTYLLSKFTKGKVTVALGGDGADELFAGYPTFQAEKLFTVYQHIPAALRRTLIKPLASAIPTGEDYFSFGFKLKKFLAGKDGDQIPRHEAWLGSLAEARRKRIVLPSVWRGVEQPENSGLIEYYLRNYLMDEVLVKVDRMSMAHALEVRAPFLDYELVDFVNNLPYEFKLRGFTGKYLLKKLMEKRLPRSSVWRKKHGFAIPVSRWLREELRDWTEATLSREKINKAGLFNFDEVEKLKNEHLSGKEDHRKQLWNLLMFQTWFERWMS